MKGELAAGDALPEIDGQHAAQARGLVHVHLVEADVAVQRRLGALQGQIRIVDERFDRCGIRGIEGDADAATNVDLMFTGRHGCRRGGLDGGDEILELRKRVEGTDNGKFIAAETRDKDALPAGGRELCGKRRQDQIAADRPVDVVDLLERLHIKGDHGDMAAGPIGDSHRRFETRAELDAVRQARQAIMSGEEGNAVFRLQALGDVFIGADEAAAGRGAILDRNRRAGGHLDDDVGAAGGLQGDKVALIDVLDIGGGPRG